MQALVAAAIASLADARTIRTQPFARQPYDLAAALMRVRVDATGRPVEPASRAFWVRAFESPELPADPARTLATALESDHGILDAAWLAGLTTAGEMRLRAERLDQFAFSQRVFGGVSPADHAGRAGRRPRISPLPHADADARADRRPQAGDLRGRGASRHASVAARCGAGVCRHRHNFRARSCCCGGCARSARSTPRPPTPCSASLLDRAN